MNEKEKAEAYVRSKCPELMELSFGCRVKVKNEDTFFTAINKPYGSLHWDFIKVAERKEVDNGINVLGLEIIGHPIQLAHVLRCITEDWRGEFLEVWDLDKDWNNQEERVFNWLCNEWKI